MSSVELPEPVAKLLTALLLSLTFFRRCKISRENILFIAFIWQLLWPKLTIIIQLLMFFQIFLQNIKMSKCLQYFRDHLVSKIIQFSNLFDESFFTAPKILAQINLLYQKTNIASPTCLKLLGKWQYLNVKIAPNLVSQKLRASTYEIVIC